MMRINLDKNSEVKVQEQQKENEDKPDEEKQKKPTDPNGETASKN